MTNHELPEIPATSVHQALALAAGERPAKAELLPTTIRLTEQDRTTARSICELNGTDLSSYLRQCTLALIKDYGFKSEEG